MPERRKLTEREETAAALLSQGLTNHQLATAMGVSVATVKRHLQHIMIKWNCNNRTQVAVRAARILAQAEASGERAGAERLAS